MSLPERTKFWLGIGFSFAATFFGVVLGFFVTSFDRNSVEQDNFEDLRRVSIDECFESFHRIDLAADKWSSRKEDFENRPLENMDILNSVPFPVIFFDALEKNLNFATHLAPESYALLLSERHELISTISTYNTHTGRVGDLTAFTRLPVVQSDDAKMMAQAMMDRDIQILQTAITDARDKVFFGCFALAIDSCRDHEEFSEFHDAWSAPNLFAEVDGSFAIASCEQMFSKVTYHSIRS